MAAAQNDASERILAYIENLPEWSQKICIKLREIILSADAGMVEEWKWGPHYSNHGMVCGFAAFQKHVKLHFFNGAGMQDKEKLFNHCVDAEFSRSIKFNSVAEINETLLKDYVLESIAVNKKGFQRTVTDKTVAVPQALQSALDTNKPAQSFFEKLTYGYKKEFVEYITLAKQEKTKTDRIAKVVAYCAEGKTLNGKYKKAEPRL